MASPSDSTPVVRTIVRTDAVLAPLAPYSQGVIADKIVYTAGCVGIDVNTGKLVPGGIKPEAEQALKNVGAVLRAAGSDFNNVVKVTVLLADIADWPTVNEIYSKYFTDSAHYPARTAYQAGALPLGSRIEIEAVGIIGEVVNRHVHARI